MRMHILPDLEETTGIPEISKIIAIIRAEISAAQTLLKTVLVRRVLSRLELDRSEKESVNNAVESLISNKELLSIGQGLVSVTPLRAIELSSSRVALLTALPDTQLSKLMGQTVIGGLQRCIELESDSIIPAMQEVQGRLLSVPDYVGLDNAPAANKQWLNELTRQQCDVMATGYSVETIENYRCYKNQKWVPSDDAPDTHSLWRGESQFGKNVFIWSDKSGLLQDRGQWLSGSDATRTRIAADNDEGLSHKLSYKVKEGVYYLTLDTYLPINEFKALLSYSFSNELVDGKKQYVIYPDCWGHLTSMFNKQLGFEFMEVV
jgi:hypothetical protein